MSYGKSDDELNMGSGLTDINAGFDLSHMLAPRIVQCGLRTEMDRIYAV